MTQLIRLADDDYIQKCADSVSFSAAVGAIVAAGVRLKEISKDAKMQNGGFLRMFVDHPNHVKRPIRFSASKGERLIKIAGHSLLSKSAHAPTLPPSWFTLYELTKLPSEKLRTLLRDGSITPATERKDVKKWLAKERQKAKSTYLANPDCKLIVGDFREKCKELADFSLDAIITDPPYPEEFIPLYEALAVVAAKKLKPEGNCLVMTGQSHLPTVMELMGQHLKYQWTLAYLSPGSSVQVFGRHVKSNWKPVLWYTGGKCFDEHVSDTVKSEKADKRFHAWGQNAQAMIEIVTRFTYPGALVLDPFLGGGATAAACKASGRQFIGIDIDQEAVDTTSERLGALSD